MNRAFYERVLFERVEEINKSKILGIDKSEMVKIRILDWGTNRDGTPFGQVGTQTFEPGMIGYMRKDSMGIQVEEGKWLMDRGHVLGLD